MMCDEMIEIVHGSYSDADDGWKPERFYDPVMIMTTKSGAQTFTGTGGITAAIEEMSELSASGGASCDKYNIGIAKNGNINIKFNDGTKIKIGKWDHPEWGTAVYLMVNDRHIDSGNAV